MKNFREINFELSITQKYYLNLVRQQMKFPEYVSDSAVLTFVLTHTIATLEKAGLKIDKEVVQ